MLKGDIVSQLEVGLANFRNSDLLSLSEARQYFLPQFPLSSVGRILLCLSLCLSEEGTFQLKNALLCACMASYETGPCC